MSLKNLLFSLTAIALIFSAQFSQSTSIWDQSGRSRTQWLLRTHLHKVGSFLYGDSHKIEYHLQRKIGSRTRLTSIELKKLTGHLSPEELEDLKEEALESALDRATRSLSLLFDVVSGYSLDDSSENADEWDVTENILDRFNSIAEFRRFPDFQSDLENLLEFEAIHGMQNTNSIRSALLEIFNDHHPSDCEKLLDSSP
jgi:hypothetical protein